MKDKKEVVSKPVEKKDIFLPSLNIQTITFPIKGKTALLMMKFPDEVAKEILEKQQGIKKTAKKLRDVKQEVERSIHRTNSGKVGFPATGFKIAMKEATSFVGNKMFSNKLVSGAVRIVNAEDGLIVIKYKKMDVLKHQVGAQTLFSPQFHDWECELKISFDANNISASDIGTLIDHAGFYVGVGMWRPKCRDKGSGEFGTFEVKRR